MAPHPENQLKRRELRGPRRSLIGLEIIVAALAIMALVAGKRSVSSGILLVVFVGATQAFSALVLAIHHVYARRVALVAALIPIAWSVAEILVFDVVTWFELALLSIGVFEVLLVAGCTPRDTGAKHPQKKKMRGRPKRS
ncbi:hypothetical protein BH11MYX2_BH11MYX2_38340 [soil metagenome]